MLQNIHASRHQDIPQLEKTRTLGSQAFGRKPIRDHLSQMTIASPLISRSTAVGQHGGSGSLFFSLSFEVKVAEEGSAKSRIGMVAAL
ncbi:hypothetical protein ED733_004533 [Metarhizium rileyi]|uniref:Uncharacterized protein n=1 Tax=Metarhizium rileyi (strain RCEF 4871) TaxID=1649241 RepID=A0A5C6G5W4_METRR|nr:hypothetical protein ED733_004533 [Metarhizium rileyi]